MTALAKLSTANILQAHQIIPNVFKNSPQFVSKSLTNSLNLPSTTPICLKIETINPIGCFKGRGVSYFMHKNNDNPQYNHIISASAGNFGQAIAYCAGPSLYNKQSTIYVSENANQLKINKMKDFGANVIQYGYDFDSAKAYGKQKAMEQNIPFIEDGKYLEIIEGAATIGLELINEYKSDIGAIFVPVGGAEMINGIGCYIKSLSKDIKIIGICSELAPAMVHSFKAKKAVMIDNDDSKPLTIADGIDVRVPVEESVEFLCEYVDDMIMVSDDEIIDAMKLLFESERIIVEPCGAVGVAGIMKMMKWLEEDLESCRYLRECVEKERMICTVLTGGNITRLDIDKYIML